jgi:hypothetical protein
VNHGIGAEQDDVSIIVLCAAFSKNVAASGNL